MMIGDGRHDQAGELPTSRRLHLALDRQRAEILGGEALSQAAHLLDRRRRHLMLPPMARPQYVAASRLRAMILELIRMHVPSVTDLRLNAHRGPYRAGNWQVEWLNVPAEDYGAARRHRGRHGGEAALDHGAGRARSR